MWNSTEKGNKTFDFNNYTHYSAIGKSVEFHKKRDLNAFVIERNLLIATNNNVFPRGYYRY